MITHAFNEFIAGNFIWSVPRFLFPIANLIIYFLVIFVSFEVFSFSTILIYIYVSVIFNWTVGQDARSTTARYTAAVATAKNAAEIDVSIINLYKKKTWKWKLFLRVSECYNCHKNGHIARDCSQCEVIISICNLCCSQTS